MHDARVPIRKASLSAMLPHGRIGRFATRGATLRDFGWPSLGSTAGHPKGTCPPLDCLFWLVFGRLGRQTGAPPWFAEPDGGASSTSATSGSIFGTSMGWSGIQRRVPNYTRRQLVEERKPISTAKAEALESAFNDLRPFLSVFVFLPRVFFSLPCYRCGIFDSAQLRCGFILQVVRGRLNEAYTKLDGRETETARHGTGEGRENPHFPPGKRVGTGVRPG